jgi:hypothetical protein
MIPILYYPIAFAGIRAVVSGQVRRSIRHGIALSATEAVAHFTGFLTSSIVDVTVNVLVITAALFWAPRWFSDATAVLIVCSVYASSMLHGGTKLLCNARFLLVLCKHHHLNLKRLLYEEIYHSAHWQAAEQISKLGVLKRACYALGRGPSAECIARQIAETAVPLIWRRILMRATIAVVTIFVYVVVFRCLVAPFLIRQSTAMSLFQAFLWPFAYSIDYFLGTSLTALIHSA